MGQVLGKKLAELGWPAFITADDVARLKHTHRIRKQLWGVEIHENPKSGGEFTESGPRARVLYARLRVKNRAGEFFQRVDGEPIPKFPVALAARELPDGDSVPFLAAQRGAYVELSDDDGTSAKYARTAAGWWEKIDEIK